MENCIFNTFYFEADSEYFKKRVLVFIALHSGLYFNPPLEGEVSNLKLSHVHKTLSNHSAQTSVSDERKENSLPYTKTLAVSDDSKSENDSELGFISGFRVCELIML